MLFISNQFSSTRCNDINGTQIGSLSLASPHGYNSSRTFSFNLIEYIVFVSRSTRTKYIFTDIWSSALSFAVALRKCRLMNLNRVHGDLLPCSWFAVWRKKKLMWFKWTTGMLLLIPMEYNVENRLHKANGFGKTVNSIRFNYNLNALQWSDHMSKKNRP